MKIVRIVGQVFVNSKPVEVGSEVLLGDMLDARGAEVELDNGTVYVGFCGRTGGTITEIIAPEPAVVQKVVAAAAVPKA